MGFKELSLHSSIVNYWAKPCLAVYLIHMAPYVLEKFCTVVGVQDYHGLSYLVLLFILPVAVYLVCVAIEICRLFVFGSIENKVISFVVK